jgi:hypothetical protein
MAQRRFNFLAKGPPRPYVLEDLVVMELPPYHNYLVFPFQLGALKLASWQHPPQDLPHNSVEHRAGTLLDVLHTPRTPRLPNKPPLFPGNTLNL